MDRDRAEAMAELEAFLGDDKDIMLFCSICGRDEWRSKLQEVEDYLVCEHCSGLGIEKARRQVHTKERKSSRDKARKLAHKMVGRVLRVFSRAQNHWFRGRVERAYHQNLGEHTAWGWVVEIAGVGSPLLVTTVKRNYTAFC